MKNRLMGLLPGIFLITLATPGFAASRDDAYTLTPFVGGHTFDNKQRLETSPTFGLRAGYNFTERWGAEAVFGYVLAESKDVNYPETDVYGYGVDALFHFNPDGDLVPFIAAGLGSITHYRPAPGLSDRTDGMFNYGLGVKYFISDAVALRGDVRQVLIPDNSNSKDLVYTLGVTFLVGGEKPAAAPASKDTTAPFVTLAAPYNATVGAPVQRKTRVAFSEPMDLATINSKTVTLSQGKTPVEGTVVALTSTTATFTQANNLAPDTVYTGKVTTGVKDIAGNALDNDYVWSFKTASLAEGKVIIIDKLVMIEDTHFKYDSAALTKEGEGMLNQNIQIMKDNSNLKVRIAGYTSASGSEAYNQALSERRAETVMAYMIVEGGLAPERFDTIGYGETRPAVYEEIPEDIRSKAAKANMRVLFEVIVK